LLAGSIYFMDEYVNPLAELERLIVERTCEWCDRVYEKSLTFHFLPRVIKRSGYTVMHRKYWRVCEYCQSGMAFDKWVFPVIQNMPEHMSLEAIMQVQPMAVHNPHELALPLDVDMVMLDYEITPEGVRRRVQVPERIRGHTNLVVHLDDATFRR